MVISTPWVDFKCFLDASARWSATCSYSEGFSRILWHTTKLFSGLHWRAYYKSLLNFSCWFCTALGDLWQPFIETNLVSSKSGWTRSSVCASSPWANKQRWYEDWPTGKVIDLWELDEAVPKTSRLKHQAGFYDRLPTNLKTCAWGYFSKACCSAI